MLMLTSHKSSTEFKVLVLILVGSIAFPDPGLFLAPLQNDMVLQQERYSHAKSSRMGAEVNLQCEILPGTQFLTNLPIFCLNCYVHFIDVAFSKINAL